MRRLCLVIIISFSVNAQVSNKIFNNIDYATRLRAQTHCDGNSIFSDFPYDGKIILQQRNSGGFHEIAIASDFRWDRIVFARVSYSGDGNYILNSAWIISFGSAGMDDGKFLHPKGIDAHVIDDRWINVFVADAGNNRIVNFKIDAETGDAVFVRNIHPEILPPKSNPIESIYTQFDNPVDVAYINCETPDDISDDIICVVDRNNHRLVWFTIDGEFVQEFGEFGSGQEQFKYPNSVAYRTMSRLIDKYELVISDAGNNRVITAGIMYDYGSGIVPVWGWNEYVFAGNPNITCVETDRTNYCFYAVDNNNHKIYKFYHGYYVNTLFKTAEYGSYGTGLYQLNYPNSIAISRPLLDDEGLRGTYTGGFLEKWDQESGAEYFHEGVEILDLTASVNPEGSIMNYSYRAASGIGARFEQIKDISGIVIRTLTSNDYWGSELFMGDIVQGNWDGRDANGNAMPMGTYILDVTFNSYYRTDAGWVDTDNKQIEFILTNAPFSVDISGPSSLGFKEEDTWYAMIMNKSDYLYQWYVKHGIGPWEPRGNEPSQTEMMFSNNFILKVVVTNKSTGETAENTKVVYYDPEPKSQFSISHFPNPFNPFLNFNYSIPGKSKVRLIIYNILGQKIITLVDEVQNPGSHTYLWNAHNNHSAISSGVYFYEILISENNKALYRKIDKILYMK